MKTIGFGIIGMGAIGSFYGELLMRNQVLGGKLVAICNRSQKPLVAFKEKYQFSGELYADYEELLKNPKVDVVLVTTPHYAHPEIVLKSLQAKKHVLCDKPLGVYTDNLHDLLNYSKNHPELTFGMMYNQRTNPLYQQIKTFMDQKRLGKLKRISWKITKWYRTQAYFDSSLWRGTYQGEGGGVFLNQALHQLDLLQWLFGEVSGLRAFLETASNRNISVETEGTVYFQLKNGGKGTFITSTTEFNGVNQLEVVGTKGKLFLEDDQLTLYENQVDEKTWNQQTTEAKAEAPVTKTTFPLPENQVDGHLLLLQNFVNGLLKDEELIAPGAEGLNAVKLCNQIYFSAWSKKWCETLDEKAYFQQLQEKIKKEKEEL